MFIVRRKDAQRDGNQPVMLYGYGGFNVTLSPSFSPSIQAWLELGGIYAVANLRGGGEYGEEWHQAGTKAKKQNVFDDFIAAAEFLIAREIHGSEALAIIGAQQWRVAGGRRADPAARSVRRGAARRRRDGHAAVSPASANARQWSSDYGLADDAEDFKALHAYSPLHNVKPAPAIRPRW